MLALLDTKLITATFSPRALLVVAVVTALLAIALIAFVGPDVAEAGRRRP